MPRRSRLALTAAVAACVPVAVAAADTVSDRQGDQPASTLDINVAGVDPVCKPVFSVTVLPQNGLRLVEPESGALPGVHLDRDGDGRTDRLIGQPKGRSAGVYVVSGTRIGRRLAPVERLVDPGQGYFVSWTVPYSQVVVRKKIRWRGVSRSAVSGKLDYAPDTGFRTTKVFVRCP